VIKNLALNQCVKENTRGNNILDLVLVYDKDLIYNLEYIGLPPVGKSDHITLKVTLNVMVNRLTRSMDAFNYNKANYALLEDKLYSIDWGLEIGKRSVEDYWVFLINLLNDFKENHIPKLNRQANNKLPWFNFKLNKMIKYRNNLFKRFKKTGLGYFKVKYNMARNKVTKQIRVAKSKYECKIIKRSKNNRKIFYTYIQSKNRKGSGKKIGPLVKTGVGRGEIVEDDREVATLLNEHFCSVFNREKCGDIQINRACSSSRVISLDNINITNEDVMKGLGDFKVNKSPGIDNITSTYALKIKEALQNR